MTEHTLLCKMAYRHYEVCHNFGMRDDPERDYYFACAALRHFTEPKRENEWRWRSDDEDFNMNGIGDIYAEYELERAKTESIARPSEGCGGNERTDCCAG